MNLKTLNVVMLVAGITLVYCGVKGYKPQDVIKWALGGDHPEGWGITARLVPAPGASSDTGSTASVTPASTSTTNPYTGGILST